MNISSNFEFLSFASVEVFSYDEMTMDAKAVMSMNVKEKLIRVALSVVVVSGNGVGLSVGSVESAVVFSSVLTSPVVVSTSSVVVSGSKYSVIKS